MSKTEEEFKKAGARHRFKNGYSKLVAGGEEVFEEYFADFFQYLQSQGFIISQWRPIEEATEEDKNDLRKILFRDPDWADAKNDDWKYGVTVGCYWKGQHDGHWSGFNPDSSTHIDYRPGREPSHFLDIGLPPSPKREE